MNVRVPQRPARFRKDYVPELDGLRGIAVLLVLWVHLPTYALGPRVADLRAALLPGNVGVDLFFVLSGFLITRILLVDRERDVPLRYFLARRFLRIFPIYYLSIAVLMPRLSPTEEWACATYTANYVFMFREATSPLEHTWSLAVEEHFYLLWPPLVAFLPPRTSRRFILWGVLPLGVLSCALALFLGDWQTHGQALKEFCQRASNVRFFSLGLGALIAFHERPLRTRPRRAWLVVVSACTVAWALSSTGLEVTGASRLLERIPATGGDERAFSPPIQALAIPFGSTALVIACVACSRSWWPHAALMRARVLQWIGRISYGLYLYHFPIFGAGVWGVEPSVPSGVRVAGVLALSVALAALSYWLFEKPLLNFGARFRGGGKSELRGPPRPRGLARLGARVAGAVAFSGLLFWTMNGGARTAITHLDNALPLPAATPADSAAVARRAAPEIVEWLHGTGAKFDEMAMSLGLDAPERFVYARAVWADGASRTGHFVARDPAAQFVDVTFVRDVARRLEGARGIAPYVQLAALTGRAMTSSSEIEARLANLPADEARLRRILVGDALAGLALAYAAEQNSFEVSEDAVRAVLEAARRVEAALEPSRRSGYLASDLFREADIDRRLRWWMVGIRSMSGVEAALRAIELPLDQL